MTGERDLLAHVDRVELQGGLGIGDDAACLPDGTLATVDALVSGVHFEPEAAPEDIANKLLAVNLSDIAAMGGRPTYALLTLAVARGFPADQFLKSFQALCRQHDVALVGGDTVSSPTTMMSLTMLGQSGNRVARRDAAQPGDVIFVTGALGGAVKSGRHLRPTPRLEEGRWLVGMGVSCLMDLSDGLAVGLTTLALESDVEMLCEGSQIPCHSDIEVTAECNAVQAALFDGEDFELLGTASAEIWEILKEGIYPLTAVGLVRSGSGVLWRAPGTEDEVPLPEGGYEHQW